jgi:hypothetical protein
MWRISEVFHRPPVEVAGLAVGGTANGEAECDGVPP